MFVIASCVFIFRQVKFMRQQSCNIMCGVYSFVVHLDPLYNQHVRSFMSIVQDQEYTDDILNYYTGLTLFCPRLYSILLIIPLIYLKNKSLFRNTISNYRITPRGKYKLFHGVISKNALWCEVEITYISFAFFYLLENHLCLQVLPYLFWQPRIQYISQHFIILIQLSIYPLIVLLLFLNLLQFHQI